MPKMELKWELTPQFFVSAANFIVLCGGLLWAFAGIAGDVKQDKVTIAALQNEIAQLKAKDESTLTVIQQMQLNVGTRLIKLETDTSYIKESVARIEQRQSRNN